MCCKEGEGDEEFFAFIAIRISVDEKKKNSIFFPFTNNTAFSLENPTNTSLKILPTGNKFTTKLYKLTTTLQNRSDCKQIL